ncbi:Uu.00g042540.m01.CDS01 [Anthostomella pinea]|uniref:Uu.00g042540.m01.CDS01 n=1 Tax=Anthostomella pinea TaxID=933095 RepID=A0AAI8VBL7_9PEZI|nr:Uu.00g042540.m01.CDS01 [Anthostomella pinea]
MGRKLSRPRVALSYILYAPTEAAIIIPPVMRGHRYVHQQLVRQSILKVKPFWVKPLRPQRRPRALTAPLPPHHPGLLVETWDWTTNRIAPQSTCAQEHCLLVTRVPLDIRVMIYREVLEGQFFHRSSGTNHAPPRKYKCLRPWQYMDGVHGSCHGSQQRMQLLSLPSTCRLIYTETITRLYAANKFDFTQSFCLLNFLNALPSARYADIRHLQYFIGIGRGLVSGGAPQMRD